MEAIRLFACIKGETAAGDDIDIALNTILENLDLIFLSVFGASKGKWGRFCWT